jgi:hypothetical protein
VQESAARVVSGSTQSFVVGQVYFRNDEEGNECVDNKPWPVGLEPKSSSSPKKCIRAKRRQLMMQKGRTAQKMLPSN